MPYHNMSLDELARHIGMDARLVRKWAEKGRLPGQMVAGQWRFNNAAMVEWLQQELHTFEAEHIRNLENAMRTGHADLLLDAHLPNEAIELNLEARTRASVLRELVAVAARTGLVYDGPRIATALEEREAVSSTALAGGFAFPHPLQRLEWVTAEPLVCFARVPAGVPFSAPDGRLTDLFVLIIATDARLHLALLARLSRMFSTDLPAALRATDDPAEALRLILEYEHVIAARGW